MTILEVLKDPIFKLPQQVFPSFNLESYFRTYFSEFQKLISKISDEKTKEILYPEIETIEKQCEFLLVAMRHSHFGDQVEAYKAFDEVMKALVNVILPKWNNTIYEGIKDPFYRARISDINKPFTREQMFHRPDRENVSTERFTASGIPGLYLANSIYVCWEELNRPSIQNMMVSRFHLESEDLKILDISTTPTQIFESMKMYYSPDPRIPPMPEGLLDIKKLIFVQFLLKWPLVAACSLKVLKESIFKPEYLIPQLFMQWISKQENIDGIKYFSVKSNPYNTEDYCYFINYAFPVKEHDENGYSLKLKKSFKLTEPISWELLQISDPKLQFEKNIPAISRTTTFRVMPAIILSLELIKGYKVNYRHTIFGRMENWLCHEDQVLEFMS